MSAGPAFAAYAAAALCFAALDAIWLRWVAVDWYREGLGHLMAETPNLVAGALFYVLFPAALVFFAVTPTASSPWPRALMYGALFGLTAYLTYDLTNLATLKAWPLGLSMLDAAWGTFASAIAALAGHAAWNALAR